MSYTLLRGSFVIRYADQPRQGPQPDGDTVKFRPDTPGLVEALPRPSGVPPDLNGRGISVRLEAVDALETHFGETHQELAGARAARDDLLARLGFSNVVYFDDLPNTVKSADRDEVRGYVLSNGIDANGRMIGFVYAGDHPGPDGTGVFLDEALADQSANAQLLTSGLAFPAFYATLPATLRTHLAEVSRTARGRGAVGAGAGGRRPQRAGHRRQPGRRRGAGHLAQAVPAAGAVLRRRVHRPRRLRHLAAS